MTNIIPTAVFQHAQDAADIHALRTRLLNSPSARLYHLRRFDDRLAAHMDGLQVAGPQALPFCDAALANLTPGALFTAAVHALNTQSGTYLARLILLGESTPDAQPGLVSAFGWTEQTRLRGTVAGLLRSTNAFERLLGMKACALHRVAPGKLRDTILESDEPALRARALRLAGEVGQIDLAPVCIRTLNDPDPLVRFWAAWAAALLGNQQVALEQLGEFEELPETLQSRALQLLVQASTQEDAHRWLQRHARQPEQLHWLIRGSGLAGEASYVTWLIGHMSDPKMARLAGEAFSLITGLDLAALKWVRAEKDADAEPNDDPTDPNVKTSEDDGLPWPDPERIAAWWRANGGHFAAGKRYFLGKPPSKEHCLEVLADGTQRQRMLAAHYLCLLQPGVPLFEWRAPAFRQQRLLAGMS